MRVLSTGLEWFTERPGGLPRYFADYTAAWTERVSPIRALVGAGDKESHDCPPYVRRVRLRSRNPMKVRQVWERTLQDEIRASQYDVFNPHFAYYAWAWSTLDLDIPVVTHFHGPWAYESKLEHGAARSLTKELRFRFQRYVEQRVYKGSDRFIVLSKSFQDELVTRYGIPRYRIHIIPGAVNVDKFRDTSDPLLVRRRLHLPEDRFILLSVRRLAYRMGLENLIHAVATLREDFPNVLLVIVGGGQLFEELSALVAQLSLEQHVMLTNRVPDDHLPLYYQAADLMVVPSVDLEGFGLVTTEAMACGTPVVGTPVGGTKEILEGFNSDLLFAGSTSRDIYDGLGRILTHPDVIPERNVTREYVLKRYTWDAVIPQIHQVFAQA